MPPSQLKRLKLSLREQGVVGPQKSKKQKRQASRDGSLRDTRIQKIAALQGIREQFNPFEVKALPRSKYDVASNKTMDGRVFKGAVSRPGATKGLGEENRQKTLLVEMQRRKKIGGIKDRRFGENDPAMTPEEKALERFIKEKQKSNKRESMFDLEDDNENVDLTHGGRSLSFGKSGRGDDFDEANLENSDNQSEDFLQERPSKRRRLSDANFFEADPTNEADPARDDRRRTKKEVMEEVIAKSKLHRYERQQAKEDDEDLRAELDKGLPDLFALMHRTTRAPPHTQIQTPNGDMNPDRMALLNGKDRAEADKEYDERLRQLAMDQRAKPTVRTQTEEDKIQQEAQRLKDLETNRLRRMRGEPEEENSDAEKNLQDIGDDVDLDLDEVNAFGLGSGLHGPSQNRSLDVEDEDEFVIEDDLVASASDIDGSDDGSNREGSPAHDADEEEFVQGITSKEDLGTGSLVILKDQGGTSNANSSFDKLAYTYTCPQTHEELRSITKDVAIEDLPTVVQRIRALYHPKLANDNKEKLGNFAAILIDHISFLANQPERPPFVVLEALIRHAHSLAKIFPEKIGRAFRSHLREIHEERPTELIPGDLIMLTAIASIFPTSDHYHQIATPAMLCMSRYLGQKIPDLLAGLAMGTYIITLCLQYQRLPRRYVPELVNYILNALWALAPVKPKVLNGAFPHLTLPETLRLQNAPDSPNRSRQLDFWDIFPSVKLDNEDEQVLKVAIIDTHLDLIEHMASIWAEHSAFCEVFDPINAVLRFLSSQACLSKIGKESGEKIRNTTTNLLTQLQKSHAARKPLRLHNHRPRAIKTSIPKFEESYNPDKHYDPDRDRAEMSKLKAEHKRERKGALRELRKDANFMAREGLREKKEKDAAYEKKYRRLVAEVQGEEGREAKSYEREKRARKGKK